MVQRHFIKIMNFFPIVPMRKNIYSKFIGCLRNINVFLDRKILATLAFTDLSAFNVIERQSRKSELYK